MNSEPNPQLPLPENGSHVSELEPGRPILRLQPNPADAALVTHESSPPVPHPSAFNAPLARRTRNGKIARLPKDLRDMINRMLFNNIPCQKIVSALKEYDIHVAPRNVSNWKTRGGYREWCLAQEHAVQLQICQDNLLDLVRRGDASELPEVGLQAAATQLSQFFLRPEAAQLLASNPQEYDRRLAMLTRVTVQLRALQKYRDDCAKELGPRHNPERIRRENEEELERTRKAYSSTWPADPKQPSIPHHNYLPKSP